MIHEDIVNRLIGESCKVLQSLHSLKDMYGELSSLSNVVVDVIQQTNAVDGRRRRKGGGYTHNNGLLTVIHVRTINFAHTLLTPSA